jgi:peptidyl-prolyl cis-trans isomerase B (cyclophilin B)
MKKLLILGIMLMGFMTLSACQNDGSSVTITFDTDGGEAISPMTITSDEPYRLPIPTKEDAIFVGWYLTRKGPDIVLENHQFETDSVTLYARYIALSSLPYANYLNETNPTIEIQVRDYGTMVLELFPSVAPNTVNNFIKHIQSNYYTGAPFHRVIEDFMIQGGNNGAVSCRIEGEFSSNGFDNPLSHQRGVLSTARTMDPNSASTQFFIMHKDTVALDGNYAAFGGLIANFAILDAIAGAPKNGEVPNPAIIIESITVDTKGIDYSNPICE